MLWHLSTNWFNIINLSTFSWTEKKATEKTHTNRKGKRTKKRKKEIISIFNSRNIAYTDPSSNFFGCLRPYFLKNIYRASHDFKMLKSDLYLRQLIIRCNQLEVFCKIHRKHLWWSLFFNKVAALSFNLCYQSACWLKLFPWT